MSDSSTTMTWTIHRQPPRQRGVVFYIVLLGIMGLLLLFSLWQDNLLFGVFVVLAVGTLLFVTNQDPEEYTFSLTTDLLAIKGEKEYELEQFSHYDVYEYHDQDSQILLVSKERLKPVLHIPIHTKDKSTIAHILSETLPRKKVEPSLIDMFSRIIGI
jgi:hypothetical protein